MPLSVILVLDINSAQAIEILEEYGVEPLNGRINERYALIRATNDEIYVLMDPLDRFRSVVRVFHYSDALLENIRIPDIEIPNIILPDFRIPAREPKRRQIDFNGFRPNKKPRKD